MNELKLIEPFILTLRNQKVILDADLAEIYGVPTKVLNQAVKRNIDRFPEDFMFRLTGTEKTEVVTNCDHLVRVKFSPQLPAAFTEHGAIMAATVLNSPDAVAMSVFVVRAFVRMREHLAANAAILNPSFPVRRQKCLFSSILTQRSAPHFSLSSSSRGGG